MMCPFCPTHTRILKIILQYYHNRNQGWGEGFKSCLAELQELKLCYHKAGFGE